MDRLDLEPNHGMHESQSRMQELLCGADGTPSEGDGATPLREWFSGHPAGRPVEQPLAWTQPRVIFVNSMSDLFRRDIPIEFIQSVFSVMGQAHWHVFQILTRRADRLCELASELPWPDNV